MSDICTSDSKIACPVNILGRHFVQRRDLHALQINDGRYICVYEPLTTDQLIAHLLGDITLGTYLLNQNNEVRFIVLDADDEKGYTRLSSLALALLSDNVPSYLEESRRGGHLWLFFGLALPGYIARSFAKGLLGSHQFENVEVFPKQDKLSGGPGSLIRMPFGFHRMTGKRYGFFFPNGEQLATTVLKQILAMESIKTVPEAAFMRYKHSSIVPSKMPDYLDVDRSNGLVSKKIRSTISVLDFVGRYIELKPTPGGAIGLCPFHDDHHPSFGVNDEDNYWHCFAGCGGGSVIDFWIKWRDCDFLIAISELAQMLL